MNGRDKRDTILNDLTVQHSAYLIAFEVGYKKLRQLTEDAFKEDEKGNRAEAKVLLNLALDIEHDIYGDCAMLGQLAEDWGVDHERDRREEDDDES